VVVPSGGLLGGGSSINIMVGKTLPCLLRKTSANPLPFCL